MRMSVDLGRLGLSALDFGEESLPKTPSTQKDLMHKLHEVKRLKDEYFDKCKKLELKGRTLEDENSRLKSLLETASPNSKKSISEAENPSDSASVYAFNILSRELSKITKIFNQQETVFKQCLHSSETNIEVYSKLHERVIDYIGLCRANDLHIQKIMNQNQHDRSSASENPRSDRGLMLEAPSLYDELKEFEEEVHEKHENAILVSEAHITKINAIKDALKTLQNEIKELGKLEIPKKHFNKDLLLKHAVRGSITFFNF